MRSLSEEPTPTPAQRAACGRVVRLVARQKRVPIRLIINPSRCRANAAKARHLAMYLSHVMLGQSLSQVAEVFGRDRTTVSYACAQVEDLRDDPTFDAEVTRLEDLIEAGEAGADE